MSVRMDDAIGGDIMFLLSLPRHLPPLSHNRAVVSFARVVASSSIGVRLLYLTRTLSCRLAHVSLAHVLVRPARSLNVKPLRAADLTSRSFLVAAFRHFPPDRARGQSDKTPF